MLLCGPSSSSGSRKLPSRAALDTGSDSLVVPLAAEPCVPGAGAAGRRRCAHAVHAPPGCFPLGSQSLDRDSNTRGPLVPFAAAGQLLSLNVSERSRLVSLTPALKRPNVAGVRVEVNGQVGEGYMRCPRRAACSLQQGKGPQRCGALIVY